MSRYTFWTNETGQWEPRSPQFMRMTKANAQEAGRILATRLRSGVLVLREYRGGLGKAVYDSTQEETGEGA